MCIRDRYQSALSEAEVDQVIKMASELPEGKRASTIGSGDGGSTRSSMIKWLPKNHADWKWLYDRMMDLSVEANDSLLNVQ